MWWSRRKQGSRFCLWRGMHHGGRRGGRRAFGSLSRSTHDLLLKPECVHHKTELASFTDENLTSLSFLIEGTHVTLSVGNFCILPYMCRHLERQWIENLYGEAYSTSSLRDTEHAFTKSSTLYYAESYSWELTYLYKNGMLLVGLLLAQKVRC